MLPVVDALRRLLQERMDELGWSQAELSRRSGVKPQTISAWMSGKRASGIRGPNRDSLRAVAVALGLPVADVFRAAGIHVPDPSPEQEELVLSIWRELSQDSQELTLEQMKLLLARDRRS